MNNYLHTLRAQQVKIEGLEKLNIALAKRAKVYENELIKANSRIAEIYVKIGFKQGAQNE